MTAPDSTDAPSGSRGVSRRTVVKGMAWSVPAIALSSAVPAYAITGPPPTVTILEACKQPGASCENDYGFVKGYTFTVQITNPDPNEPIYIYTDINGTLPPYFAVTSSVPFTYGSARLFTPVPPTIGAPVPASLLIPAGGTVYIIINAGTNSNSANTDAIGSLYFAWGHTAVAGNDTDHPYVPAPPILPPGEGWVGSPFSFDSTPPCSNCLPD